MTGVQTCALPISSTVDFLSKCSILDTIPESGVCGIIRVRKKGSAGGHNGLKNIIQHLGKDQFVRIKVGVGEKPAGYDLADYVLGHFDREEQVLMKQVSEEVCEAVQMILEKGPDAAMNVYNGRKVEKA